ncbi:MAG TPA: MGMT family protein [Candidatus Paceibacterota bacterium]
MAVTNLKTFKERVLQVVREIPQGSTLTYTDVAARAGSPRAARAVGNIMKANYDKTVPCHRVIKADGSVGDYNRGGRKQKIKLLKEERVL